MILLNMFYKKWSVLMDLSSCINAALYFIHGLIGNNFISCLNYANNIE